jgi:hypothetical protein
MRTPRHLVDVRRALLLASGMALLPGAGFAIAGCFSDSSGPTACSDPTGAACLDATTPEASPGEEAAVSPDASASPVVDAGARADDASEASDATAEPDATDAAAIADAAATLDAGDASDGAVLPTVLATDTDPYYLALGGGFVYWANSGSGIARVPTGGGAATTISTHTAEALTADANNVYWVDPTGVYQCAHSSATPQKIAAVTYTSTVIVTDGAYVYWNYTGTNSSFFKVPVGGTDAGTVALTPQTLDSPSGLAFLGGKTYIALTPGGPAAGMGVIGVLPGDGGAPVNLVTSLDGPQQLISDGTRLYWVNDTGGTPDGIENYLPGTGSFVYTTDELHPHIATDAVNLYYTDATGQYVIRRPLVGLTGAQVIWTTSYPWAIGVDGTYVYWTDRIDHKVYRAAK